jgi:molybdopterin-guanine dinucleotide biosynthesis protein A
MKEHHNITGIILAGGKSTRIGTDKAFLKLNGITFIEHITKSISPFVSDIIIVSNNTAYDKLGFKRVEDLIKDSGPLAGLYTGLHYSKTAYNLVLSCDVPLVNNRVLNTLIDGIDGTSEVIQLKSLDRTIPLIAIYKKECVTKCLELLNKGERRLRAFVNQLNTKTITLKSDLDIYVQNINTLEQFKDIEHAIEH